MNSKGIKLYKARLELLGALAAVILINLIQEVMILLPVAILIFMLVGFKAARGKLKLERLKGFILLAAGLSIIQLATSGTQTLYRADIFGITISLYSEGLARAVAMFLKISSSMGAIILLMGPTNMVNITATLRKFGLPGVFTDIMVIAVKYIFLFRDEVFTIKKAQKSRLGYRSLRHSLHSAGAMGGIILCRAFDRSSVLEKALKSRGYNGGYIVMSLKERRS